MTIIDYNGTITTMLVLDDGSSIHVDDYGSTIKATRHTEMAEFHSQARGLLPSDLPGSVKRLEDGTYEADGYIIPAFVTRGQLRSR